MKCQVTSDTIRRVMISREVEVASHKEICRGEKIRVHIGYNQQYQKVEDGELLHWPPNRNLRGNSQISQDWEIYVLFFSIHNIEPVWSNCDFEWGHYDEEQGAWTGCMGKV